MSLASSDVPKDDAPARKSATSKKDSTKSFPKLFEEAFARTDGDNDLLLRAARVKEARASAAQLPPAPPPPPAAARPVRLDDDDDEEEEDARGRGEEAHQRWCRGRRCALISLFLGGEPLFFLTFGEKGVELTPQKRQKKKKKKKKTSTDTERERERERERKRVRNFWNARAREHALFSVIRTYARVGYIYAHV